MKKKVRFLGVISSTFTYYLTLSLLHAFSSHNDSLLQAGERQRQHLFSAFSNADSLLNIFSESYGSFAFFLLAKNERLNMHLLFKPAMMNFIYTQSMCSYSAPRINSFLARAQTAAGWFSQIKRRAYENTQIRCTM